MTLFNQSAAQNTLHKENHIVSSPQSKFLRNNKHSDLHRKAQTETITWTFTSYDDLTLGLGSTIEFVNSGFHNLYIMPSKSSFDNCDFSTATKVDPQTYTNDGMGETVYFACGVGSHCSAGDQKIKVTFGDSVETGSPTLSPTISPTKSNSPTMSPTTTGFPTSTSSEQPTNFPGVSPLMEIVEWSLRTYESILLPPRSSIGFVNQGSHDLLIMETLEKYQNCDFSGATLVYPQIYENDGTEETIYFACSIGPHCGLGMKVAVVFGDEIADDTDDVGGFSIVALILSLLSCLA